VDPDPLPLGFLETSFLLIGQTQSWTTLVLLIALLVVLLLCSALISASEVAYFSLSPQDIEKLEKDEAASSKRILQLKEKPRNLLATILISNNFINIAIVVLSEVVIRDIVSDETFLRWAENLQPYMGGEWLSIASLSRGLSYLITVVIVTFLLVLFGEVAPKIYANINNIRHAQLMSRPLGALGQLFYPLSGLLLGWSGGIEERVYRRRLKSGNTADRKEIDKAIELTVSEGGDQEEVDMLKGIIAFGDVETKQIMKSRVDVIGLDQELGFKEVIDVIKSSGFSRLVDEYGGCAGIVTLEDVMEEVVGDIRDEFDADDVDYERIDDRTYIFEGKTLLNDVGRVLALDTDIFEEGRGSADSLAGLILELESIIPRRNRVIQYKTLKFTIVKATKRRIEKVKGEL